MQGLPSGGKWCQPKLRLVSPFLPFGLWHEELSHYMLQGKAPPLLPRANANLSKGFSSHIAPPTKPWGITVPFCLLATFRASTVPIPLSSPQLFKTRNQQTQHLLQPLYVYIDLSIYIYIYIYPSGEEENQASKKPMAKVCLEVPKFGPTGRWIHGAVGRAGGQRALRAARAGLGAPLRVVHGGTRRTGGTGRGREVGGGGRLEGGGGGGVGRVGGWGGLEGGTFPGNPKPPKTRDLPSHKRAILIPGVDYDSSKPTRQTTQTPSSRVKSSFPLVAMFTHSLSSVLGDSHFSERRLSQG